MSKELIERMRSHADAFMGGVGGLRYTLLEAADALEAKAAPVGEREAFEAWFFCPSNSLLAEWEDAAREAFQAGAAYQRAQQPPSAVPDAWKLAVDNVAGYAHLYNSGSGIIHEIRAEQARLLAAAPSAPKADDPVKVQLLEALESAADALARAEFFEQADNARAAISAVREEVMK